MCIQAKDCGVGVGHHRVVVLRRATLLPVVNEGLAFSLESPPKNKSPLIAAIQQKAILMKNRYIWAGTLALAIGAVSQVEAKAAYTNQNGTIITNGTIIVTTRAANDGHFFTQSSSSIDDMDDNRGSGTSPGDVAMCELLQDNGYTTKLLPDKALAWFTTPVGGQVPCLDVYGNPNNPALYYTGYPGPANAGLAYNEKLSAMLVVVSGSGSSSDAIQPNTNGVPIMCGESSHLGSSDVAGSIPGSHGELFLYNNRTANNLTTIGGDYQYMKVLLPNHPIMQGIPLVASTTDTNRVYVKFIRDAYPNENAHCLIAPNGTGGLPNYQVSTCYADIGEGKSVPAAGLKIIGVLAANTNYSIFAVMDRGGLLGDTSQDVGSPWFNYTTAPARMVHFFVNEQGSSNARRSFNALSVWGRILFVRAAKWAMEENLAPYQGLGIIDVGMVSPSNIRLSWTGSKDHNYRIYGATDIVNPNWIPVVDSITNKGDGVTVTRTLNITSAPQTTFLRVGTLPELAVSWVAP